jgi:prolipoprotein diacylglyceryltransferase
MMNLFALMIGSGASLGLWQVARNAPKRQAERWVSAGLWMLAAALVGARLVFVLFHLEAYSNRPFEAFAFWFGGLEWPGAVFGGLLSLNAIAHRTSTSLRVTADRLSPMIAPLLVTGWLGCLPGGCAYGPLAPGRAWWGLPVMDETGMVSPRLPLQLLAALAGLAVYGWLEFKPPNWTMPGQKALVMQFGLATNLLIFSILRADPIPNWLGFRADFWLAAVFMLLTSLFWGMTSNRKISH